MPEFVHLHNHTDFSLLDGAASIKDLVSKAKSLGMKGLAITDHGNMFGALRFYRECKAQEINPIVGSEFYTVGAGKRQEKVGTESGGKYYHLILLAKNEAGYRNLMELSSTSYRDGFYYKPRIDDEVLLSHTEGLICCSACIAGEIPSLILRGKLEEAEKKVLLYKEAFGPDNFYLELQDHGIPEEKTSNQALVKLSRKLGVPLIATNDLHYVNKSDAQAHDILLCIGTNHKKNDRDRMRFCGPEFYLKNADEMAALFPELPEALENTLKISEMCALEIPKPGPLLPAYQVPETYTAEEDHVAEPAIARVKAILEGYDDKTLCKPHPKYKKVPVEELAPAQRKTVNERLMDPITRYFIHSSNVGMRKRYPEITPEIQQRLDYELSIIILMDFVGYFLIVADFINWGKDNGIPVGPGRGSGAGSLVAYSQRITDIDPLRYELLFERFLNPERVSMPDFDVDFCFERRQEVIDYVTRKYGSDRVGQIITFGTLKAKAVIKDVARALDIPFDEANQIAKLVPEDPHMTLKLAFEQEPKLKELAEDPRYKELFDVAKVLEGKNRHTSYHAAGIVIGKTKLVDYVPLFKDPHEDTIASQYTMDLIEDCGLVKMDFLGLKTLTLIKHTVDLIKKRGIEIEESTIPETDKKTYDMLSDGMTTSVFQFESSGMQSILKQAKPNRMEDLIALNALYRPGPMDYIPQFINGKWDPKTVKYPDPSLEPILKETYGVIVYQEQVMQVAQKIAGYTLGQADMLRRAMSKKKHEVLEAERKPFGEGAVKGGYTLQRANEVYDILIPFASYGFNKSHAAAYSVVAYRTAYLKANYPAEFMAANLTNEITNQDKLQEYIGEARKMGIDITPPDINFSEKNFTVVDGKIVYGLIGMKGVGAAAVDEITAAREAGGPFKDFIDFLDRVDLKSCNKKVLETLILTGSFDKLGHNRASLMRNLEPAAAYAQNKKDSSKYGQNSLFEACEEEEFPDYVYQECEEYPRNELLQKEKELLGFFFSGHPLDDYRQAWERSVDLDLSHPERSSPDKVYTILGLLKAFREIPTKKGSKMAFATLEDFKGSIELVLFPQALEKFRERFVLDAVMAIKGKVDTSRDKVSFKVEDLAQPEDLKARSIREVHIRLDLNLLRGEDDVAELRELVFENSGSCNVLFHMTDRKRETIVKAAQQIGLSPSDEVLGRLKQAYAVSEVWKE
jgi:DNA polymerase-3 subunit alpha